MSVLFILKGYPRLSETFIAQEILALEQRGIDIAIASLRHPTDRQTHRVHREISAGVTYLPEYLHDEPARVAQARTGARRLPGYRAALAAFRADLRRDPTHNRIRRFGQACVLAHEMPGNVTWLHAHFLHTPASVTRYAALMTGLPWSCSAHAKDIWTTPKWDITEKLAELDWLVTCTDFGARYLSQLAARRDVVSLIYHGLDFSRFRPPATTWPPRDGADGRDAPVTILSVGRAVEKKGYGDLLDALAGLPPGLNWRFRHIGGGDLLTALRDRATELSIAERIEWLGPATQETVLAALRDADIFALASKIAADGDRDGLPNVLMEAQSQGLCVMSTNSSAIPELIQHKYTGLLVEPGDVAAMTRTLARLIGDPGLRHRLGQAGQARVRAEFSLDAGADQLAARFRRPAHTAAA
jgi:glycosyltransferase involved in cell wall biosynthesis